MIPTSLVNITILQFTIKSRHRIDKYLWNKTEQPLNFYIIF